MATRGEILQAADDRAAAIWSQITSRQDTYFAANGRHWQGRRTHSVVPADGAEAAPDIGTARPVDSTAWPAGIRAASLPCAIQSTAYDGPTGKGYQVTLTVRVAGQTWERTQQSGPEVWRNHGWERVDP